MNITLLDWAGCRCAVVWCRRSAFDKFIANLRCKADVRAIGTESLNNAVPAGRLRDGWERSARESGAVWAIGMSAVSFSTQQ